MKIKSKVVYLYTDGSSLGNPGPGGYGLRLEEADRNHVKEFSQGFLRTTNNRMELLAVIVGLELLKKQPLEVMIYSDSKYVIDSVEKKWVFGWEKKKFKDKKNSDLWKRFLIIYIKSNIFNYIQNLIFLFYIPFIYNTILFNISIYSFPNNKTHSFW